MPNKFQSVNLLTLSQGNGAAGAQVNTERIAHGGSISPASLNPGGSNSQPGTPNFNHKISGIPCVAAASRYTAPVHIDVGGTIYTSSLETLTKHPDSRLARMFNGSIPIVLDSLKQHYFIDRDGEMFRHILNFLRTNTVPVTEDFPELDLLYEEAKFYDISALIRLLDQLKKDRQEKREMLPQSSVSQSNCAKHRSKNGKCARYLSPSSYHNSEAGTQQSHIHQHRGCCCQDDHHTCSRANSRCSSPIATSSEVENDFQCLALNISPELGERIMISGRRTVVEEVFPEISQVLMDGRTNVAWNQDSKHVIRFPLNGYCKLNSLQTISRLLNNAFRIYASNGGGVEGQQFSEYLFVRNRSSLL